MSVSPPASDAAARRDDFLSRIGLGAVPPVDGVGLAQLVSAFRRQVPFENLDVLAGVPVTTERDRVRDKIVQRRRGGWCFELNVAFATLLCDIGFDVDYRLARVAYRRQAPGPLAHLALQVRCARGSWLVDVGFGALGPGVPLPDPVGRKARVEQAGFRLTGRRIGQRWLSRWIDGEWVLLYRIEPLDVLDCDLEVAAHYLSTSPTSGFLRRLACSTDDGVRSRSIEGAAVIERDAQWRELARWPITGARQLRRELGSGFGLEVPQSLVNAAWSTMAQPLPAR